MYKSLRNPWWVDHGKTYPRTTKRPEPQVFYNLSIYRHNNKVSGVTVKAPAEQ